MSDHQITKTHHTEIPAYTGPHAIPGIRFRAARQALGVSAWGMNVLEIDAGADGYPRHNHQSDGQEEVYVVLAGAGVLHTPDGDVTLRSGDMVRVPPASTRSISADEGGITVLALGGTPGAPYTPSPGM